MGVLGNRTAVVVDGHPLWIDALSRLLETIEIAVVASSTECGKVGSLVSEQEPDVLVLGLDTIGPDADHLRDLREVTAAHPDLKAVVVGSAHDHASIDAAFAAGATAYCMKSARPDDLMAAIRQSFEHSIYFAASRATPVASDSWAAAADEPELTKREIEILRLVAEGHSNAHLARMLWVTEQTVKFHLSNIYRKLDVANRTEASRWAQVHGLLAASPAVVQTAA
jgi:DNA-binding NarL/FixJ family response regulator